MLQLCTTNFNPFKMAVQYQFFPNFNGPSAFFPNLTGPWSPFQKDRKVPVNMSYNWLITQLNMQPDMQTLYMAHSSLRSQDGMSK